MTINLNYHKRKNTPLFQKMQQHKGIQLTNIQNYIPIYNTLFALNENNYNSINLNHLWSITDIKEHTNHNEPENIFKCKLTNILADDIVCDQKVFFKMAPLLDPFKYIIGKYNHNDSNLFNLPLPSFFLSKDLDIHPKLLNENNSSYIDGFFAFLTSQLLNTKQFIHGLDYYGSFLSIKNNFKINVIDDLDYLIKSTFFNNNKNILFQIEEYSHLIIEEIPKKPIIINQDNDINNELSVESIDSIYLNKFNDIFINENENDNENKLSNDNIKDLDNLEDLTDTFFQFDEIRSTTLKSDSTCSSRTSHTNDNDLEDDDDDDDDNMNNDLDSTEDNSNSSCNGDSMNDSSDEYEEGEEKLYVTIPKFPVQVICMENCEETLDDLIINNTLSIDEWFSALMQIIMILITYQKLFSFTHNDLHTNNIMYTKTNIKYLYYIYKKKCYKVPTFGKIFKIIDFGRAIYKFNGNIYCSDSFQIGEDAATQYNTEPYFNDKKPRLEPNFSFDLCRLACSIFDYVVEDFDNIKHLQQTDPVVKIIIEWCLDDNGINVLYKNNGVERYPDFKLYKMISRYVHNHTPAAQLNRNEFKKYIISKVNMPKDCNIMNIDELQ
jgi:hypothetical protein